MRHLVFVGVLISALAAPAFAAPIHSVTGMWHGRIQFDMNNLPRVNDKKQNSGRTKYLNQLEQAALTLVLKGDRTYTLNVIVPGHGSQHLAGRWTLSGSIVSLEQLVGGKYSGDPQTYTLDRNAKSMSLKKTDASGLHSTVTYFR